MTCQRCRTLEANLAALQAKLARKRPMAAHHARWLELIDSRQTTAQAIADEEGLTVYAVRQAIKRLRRERLGTSELYQSQPAV